MYFEEVSTLYKTLNMINPLHYFEGWGIVSPKYLADARQWGGLSCKDGCGLILQLFTILLVDWAGFEPATSEL